VVLEQSGTASNRLTGCCTPTVTPIRIRHAKTRTSNLLRVPLFVSISRRHRSCRSRVRRVTTAAFVLSIIALVTNAWFTWLRWPRIAVEVSRRVHVSATLSATATPTATAVVVGRDEPSAAPPTTDPAPPQQGFRGTAKSRGETPAGTASGTYSWAGSATGSTPPIALTVVNNGSDAVTIKTIGFRAANQQRSRTYLDFLETWRNPGKAALPTIRGIEALLPERIDGHDCRIYEYSEDALKALPAGEYRGYAQRYKSFRIWPKCNRPTVRESRSKDTIARQPP
jgi:hypothetical protein